MVTTSLAFPNAPVAEVTVPALAPSRSAAAKPREHGIDVARSFAMLGMLLVHTVTATLGNAFDANTSVTGRVLGPLVTLASGRAQATFVILAGLMIGWQALRARTPAARRTLRISLVKRGVVIFLIGLALQLYQEVVAQILMFYGAYFVIAALLIAIPSRWLLVGAVSAALVLPVARASYEMHAWSGTSVAPHMWATSAEDGESPPLLSAAPQASVLSEDDKAAAEAAWEQKKADQPDLAVTEPADGELDRIADELRQAPKTLFIQGTYPLIPEIALFLFGMALAGLGLSGLGSPRLLIAGLGGLVVLPVLSNMIGAISPENPYLAALYVTDGHMPATFTLLTGWCYALVALGVGIRLVRRVPRAAAALAALGRWSLTFYIAHIVALVGFGALGAPVPLYGEKGQIWTDLLGLGLIASIPITIAALSLKFAGRRGPMEALVHRLSGVTRGRGGTSQSAAR